VLNTSLHHLGAGLSVMDIIDNGNIGLMLGIEEIQSCTDGKTDDFLKLFI
jgi:hypothetical protein